MDKETSWNDFVDPKSIYKGAAAGRHKSRMVRNVWYGTVSMVLDGNHTILSNRTGLRQRRVSATSIVGKVAGVEVPPGSPERRGRK